MKRTKIIYLSILAAILFASASIWIMRSTNIISLFLYLSDSDSLREPIHTIQYRDLAAGYKISIPLEYKFPSKYSFSLVFPQYDTIHNMNSNHQGEIEYMLLVDNKPVMYGTVHKQKYDAWLKDGITRIHLFHFNLPLPEEGLFSEPRLEVRLTKPFTKLSHMQDQVLCVVASSYDIK